MSGPEGTKPPVETEMPKVDMNSIRERQERYRQSGRKFTLNYYGLADYFLDESVEPDIGENGHDAVTMWLDGAVSPHGATEINGYGLQSLLGESFAFRVMKDSYTKRSARRILRELNDLSIKISGQDTDSYTGTPDVDRYDKVLVSAIAKDRLREEIELHKDKGKKPNFVPEEAELGLKETEALMKYEKRVENIKHDCAPCGEFGEVLEARVIGRIDILADEALLTSGLLDEKKPEDKKIIDRVEERLKSAKRIEARSMMKMTAAEQILKESIRDGRGGAWLQLVKSTSGAASIFNGNKQWMENQSDLEPIGRMWEMLGRMTEFHPSNVAEALKRWPSFGEGFKGLAAICSGKYALGSNGEIYPTGAYGLGYIENGKIIDVDDAYIVDANGRRTGLRPGVTRLEESQIWVDGKVVEVNNRVDLDTRDDKRTKFNGYTGKVEIKGEPVEIFSKNILYWEGINDANVQIFMDGIKKYVTGVETAQGKEPWDVEIDLGVALARNLFEMSMLSSWYGVPRDSKGKPYYGLYEPVYRGAQAPIRHAKDMWEITSKSESKTAKLGWFANGWDEGSLFPYTINDFGKLTLTRGKQANELWKGRPRGLFPLVPYLPESLAKPMLDDEVIQNIITGVDKKSNKEYTLEGFFRDMKSVGRLKVFWLDIAKSIAVYEFISSTFVGDKDPTAAQTDLLNMMIQPRNFEKLTKNIDLSIFYTDKREASRLKVNIVTAALAAVSEDLKLEKFLGVGPTGSSRGKLEKRFFEVTKEKLSDKSTEMDTFYLALRQLISSEFIGGEGEVMKILNRIKDYRSGKVSELGFSMAEFEKTFESDYYERIWKNRESKKNTVMAR